MRIILTDEEYDEFVAILEGPPRQCPKLVKTLSQESPFIEEENGSGQNSTDS